MATLSASLKNIEPLAALADVKLTGRGSLQAQLTSGATRRVNASGELAVDGGDAVLVHLLAPRAKLSASLIFSDNNFQIERSSLEAAKLQLAVHGGDASGKLALDFKFALPDLAALTPALAGQLGGEARLQGVAPSLTLAADVTGTLSAHGTTPGPIRLSLQARDMPQRPNGRFDLTGTLDESPVHLAASVERDAAGTLSAKIERGEWKSARLDGELRIDTAASDPKGHLELHVAHLEDLDRLLGQSVQGSLDASALFDRTAGHSRAQITLDAHDAGIPAQQLQLLQLRGDIAEPLLRPVLALHLTAQALRSGALAKLAADVSGPVANPRLHASGSVQVGTAPALQLDTTATFNIERREMRLFALRADYREQTLRLLAPTRMSFGDGFAFEQLRLGMGDSTLQASGRVTPTLQLQAALGNFTPAQLRVLWPDLQAEGRVDANVDLTGSLAHPQGLLKVQGRGLRAINGAARGLPATDIDASAQLQGQVVQVELQLHAGDGLQMQASGQVPLNRDAPIALKLSGNFNLNVINPIIEASGQRVLGAVRIDAELAGTPAAPQARGTLVLSGGDLQDYPRGLHLSDISATLAGDGDQVRLQELTAHAGAGTVSASGTLGLGGGDLPVALQINSHGAKPFASDLLTATIDMDLKISGGLRSQLNATGSVQIDHADINIPNALPPDVVVLNVIRPGEKPAPVAKTPATLVMLNLTVAAPRAVFVRGRGLDAELGGQLHVGGSSADPDISGGFDLRNGTVNVAGATLTFTSGRVGFNGYGVKKKIDPTLDFASTTNTGGVKCNADGRRLRRCAGDLAEQQSGNAAG